MQIVTTEAAPLPAGHYSQGIVHNGVVYVAGQLPIVPGSSDRTVGSMAQQAEQTLRNVESVLQAAGSGLDKVLQMTIYVSDISLWGEVNVAYARVMGDHKPARAVVPVKELHYGYQIEIQAIAAL
ncbi:MAG: RidA family protein [Gemmatimonadetes bacterium]|nr:RidA family protein [Gemmatimonadota bacterium]MBK8646055.1 RidA family protein [Gemmatimonadota bacterium]